MRQQSPGTVVLEQQGREGASTRPERLLTIDDVADWLGVPKGTLYQWRSRGLGPVAIKVGGALRYRRADVDDYLDQHRDPGTR